MPVYNRQLKCRSNAGLYLALQISSFSISVCLSVYGLNYGPQTPAELLVEDDTKVKTYTSCPTTACFHRNPTLYNPASDVYKGTLFYSKRMMLFQTASGLS